MALERLGVELRLVVLADQLVGVLRRGGGGVIQIDFGSETELNRIYELLTNR